MPVAKATALELIRRLRWMDRYPQADGDEENYGEDSLAAGLEEVAPSLQAAEGFVVNWPKQNGRAPKTHEIYEYFDRPASAAFPSFAPLKPGEEPPPPEYFCTLCEDSGWYQEGSQTTKRLPARPDLRYEPGYKRCDHPPQYRGSKPR